MQTQQANDAPAISLDDGFIRLPGLFRRWEIEQVVDPGADFHFEEAGEASDGTPLFAVYRRERSNPNRSTTKER